MHTDIHSANPLMPPSLPPESMADRIRLIMRLRSSGITDTGVLSALENTPREFFVPEMFADKAYEDTALPIACTQTISQPSIVGWMTWALELSPRSRVLEIGTGSGYQTAILAKLSRLVYSVERHQALMSEARARLEALGLSNIILRHGDGAKGWKEAAPFDRIMVTAAAAAVPAALLEQLAPGGVMVLPVGQHAGDQLLLRIRKDLNGEVHTQHLMHVRFVPLVEGRTV